MRTNFILVLLAIFTSACSGMNLNISLGAATPTPTSTDTPTPTSTATINAAGTATAHAQSTATAQAAASSTARAQSTSTAQAQATARAKATSDAIAGATQTTQALVAAVDSLCQTARRAYFSDKGRIDARPPYVSIENSNTSIRNFCLEVKFLNPGPDWAYQIGFRNTGPYSHYRLILNSSAEWGLIMPTGTGGANVVSTKTIGFGRANGIDLSPTGSNQLRFVVNDKVAFLFLNGQFVSAMDVSAQNTAGDLWIGSGGSFQFENWLISGLP